jgi:hypothetical protein
MKELAKEVVYFMFGGVITYLIHTFLIVKFLDNQSLILFIDVFIVIFRECKINCVSCRC